MLMMVAFLHAYHIDYKSKLDAFQRIIKERTDQIQTFVKMSPSEREKFPYYKTGNLYEDLSDEVGLKKTVYH